jgi:hypothetical protein
MDGREVNRGSSPDGAIDAALSNVRRVLLLVSQVSVLAGALAVRCAYADDIRVYSPYVTQGRTEVEFHGYSVQDGDSSLDGARGSDFSVAYGVTDWWKPEVYFLQYEREPGEDTRLAGAEFENTFQLAPMGEYWIDPGFLFSYEHVKASGEPDVVEFGPLLAKRVNRVIQRLNLIWEKQIGAGAGGKYEFRSAYSIHYQLRRTFEPGIEAYYRPNDDATQLGPAISGEIFSITGWELEYGFGVIFGINSHAADRTMVAHLEFEF